MKSSFLLAATLVAQAGVQFSSAQIGPAQRTADMPDSWLVLYNLNDTVSTTWKDWYCQQWGIPASNVLGLNVSPTDERVQSDYFNSQIFNVVHDYLEAHPDLKAQIMGILVGYRVPGNFYIDGTHPPLQGGGGYSASSKLQDLTSATWYKRSNPYFFLSYLRPPTATRLTKATLADGCYLTARLDGPSIDDVAAMTTRARTITTSTSPLPVTDRLYYDYVDVGAPGGDAWTLLQLSVASRTLNAQTWRFPWVAYDSDTELMPNCTMTFNYYRISGWDTVPWGGTPTGTRILAYALNSWGATTVRSTTDLGGRFVPNALTNGRFAAALGSTAEPYLGAEPALDTVVWCLAQGWTLGEAVFRASPFRSYMWELVGDPLLKVPFWFANAAARAPTALGPPCCVNNGETSASAPRLEFTQLDDNPDDLLIYHLQIDDSADFSFPVVDYKSAPLAQGPTQFTVGQSAGAGTYLAGAESQLLPLGSYYWRVQSDDGTTQGSWSTASNNGPAFTLVEPLPLVMVSAVSRKTHGSRGEFDLPLVLDPTPLASSECRVDTSAKLVLTFNRPVTAVDGVLDGTEVSLSVGTLRKLTTSGRDLIIELALGTTPCCLLLHLTGICDLAGMPLSGNADLHVRFMPGDTNGDGKVDLLDMVQTKSFNAQPLSPATARFDVNLDGCINLIDTRLIKSFNSSPCSAPNPCC